MNPMRRQNRMSTLRMIALSSSAENVARNAARASGSLRKSRDRSSNTETSVLLTGTALLFSMLLRSSPKDEVVLTTSPVLPKENVVVDKVVVAPLVVIDN